MESIRPAIEELLIAGVGGWGIVAMGDMLAKAAMKEYKYVTWFPSYATMMRGGESECCVIFSNEKIPSPIIQKSKTVVVLGAWRVPDFEDRVTPGGLMIVDTSGGASSGVLTDIAELQEKEKQGVEEENIQEEYRVRRDDIRVEYVAAMDVAYHLGNMRNANLVMLGAYIGITKSLSPQLVIDEIQNRFGKKGREEMVAACKQAFNEGTRLRAEG